MDDELKDATRITEPATTTQEVDETWDWVLAAGVSREDLRKALQSPPPR